MTSTNTVPIETATTRSGPRKANGWDAVKEHVPFALMVWWAHLLVTQSVAYISYRYGEVRSVALDSTRTFFEPSQGAASSAYQVVRPPLGGWQHWIVEPFRNWDGTWYSMIAEQGYSERFPATAAFFPLYPWLMDWGNTITGLPVETVGWLVSRLAFLGALIMVSALVTGDFDIRIARWTVIAIAVFPTSFFFGAIYTESLFLFLAATTLWAARKNDWLLAVIVCFLAVLTRSAGIMLGIPMAVLFVQQHGRNLKAWIPKALLGLVPPLGLVIFGFVLRSSNLGFFDWQNQQWQWNRFTATPIRTFSCVMQGCEAEVRSPNGGTYDAVVHPVSIEWIRLAFENRLSWSYLTSSEFRYLVGQSQVTDVLVTLIAFALIIIGFKKLPLYYSAWTVVPMIVPLLAPSSVFPLMSMPRFVLPLVPLLVMAVILIYPRKKLAITLASISTLLLMLYTSQFSLWYWVA